MKRSFVPGSYDPPTKAHAFIWERLATLSHVTIGIGRNSAKAHPLLLEETRATLIRDVMADVGVNVEVVIYDDLVDACATRVGADMVVRGLRGVEDLSTETAFLDYLDRRHGPPVLFMPAPAPLRACSSSFVRGLLPFAGADPDLEELLPRRVFRCLRNQAVSLRPAFETLWAEIGASGDARPVFEDLLLRYSDGHREYHTMTHVRWGLHRLEQMRLSYGNDPTIYWPAIQLAYWFHDAILEGHPLDEMKSSFLAEEVATRAGLAPETIDKVGRLIRATAHEGLAHDREAAILTDADLSILGASEEDFDRYEGLVRREWEFVPEADFKAHRAVILQRFLDRPTIYVTPYARERWEARAQENLHRSMKRLKEGLPAEA